jgi:hypothetical protein
MRSYREASGVALMNDETFPVHTKQQIPAVEGDIGGLQERKRKRYTIEYVEHERR